MLAALFHGATKLIVWEAWINMKSWLEAQKLSCNTHHFKATALCRQRASEVVGVACGGGENCSNITSFPKPHAYMFGLNQKWLTSFDGYQLGLI